MNQEYIQQYYHLQHEAFCNHIKFLMDAFEKVLALKDDQVTDQQREAIRALKAVYAGQTVEDIERDLATGHVTMKTVEKRVQLDVDAFNVVIELLKPAPMMKIFLELLLAEQANEMRATLNNQVLWLNNVR